jgi:succinate dehydrogenase/fumarate reductase flavoprotein subunit
MKVYEVKNFDQELRAIVDKREDGTYEVLFYDTVSHPDTPFKTHAIYKEYKRAKSHVERLKKLRLPERPSYWQEWEESNA